MLIGYMRSPKRAVKKTGGLGVEPRFCRSFGSGLLPAALLPFFLAGVSVITGLPFRH
jgi:hypothetical protein